MFDIYEAVTNCNIENLEQGIIQPTTSDECAHLCEAKHMKTGLSLSVGEARLLFLVSVRFAGPARQAFARLCCSSRQFSCFSFSAGASMLRQLMVDRGSTISSVSAKCAIGSNCGQAW